MDEEPDPEGDLLIILTPSSEPFAPWDDDPEAISILSASKSMAQKEAKPATLKVRVSSKHMCHASPRFKKMLTGPWLEAITIHSDGRRHVEMEGFDAEAFQIVMHVIHLNHDLVPLHINVDMLAKIAVLVDDLQCQRALSMLATMWIQNLPREYEMPRVKERPLTLWIFISSVFRRNTIFKRLTCQAILNGVGPMPTLNLPIHSTITQRIDLERMTVLKKILKILHNEVDELSAGRGGLCTSQTCRIILLGSLVKWMRSLSLPSLPLDSRSYTGLQIAEISSAVRRMATTVWYDRGHDLYHRPVGAHSCDVRSLISRHIDKHVTAVKGLDLEELFPKKSKPKH